MLQAVASQELVHKQSRPTYSEGGGCRSWPGNEAEMGPGRKYEDVKTSFLSAEQIEKGEQEAISLQLYAKRIT